MKLSTHNPNETIPASAATRPAGWFVRLPDSVHEALAARLNALNLRDEIGRAIDNAKPVREIVAIPASADDFVRTVEANRIKAANGFTFVPLAKVRLS